MKAKTMILHMACTVAALIFAACSGVTPDEENGNDNEGDDVVVTPENPTEAIDGSSFLKPNSSTGLTLSATKNFIQIGKDTTFFILRYDSEPVKDGYKIYHTESTQPLELPTAKVKSASGEIFDLPYWMPDKPVTKTFWATYKTSNTKKSPLKISAVDIEMPSAVEDPDPESTNFVKRPFILDFTGTACGFCPFIIATIDYLVDDEGAEYEGKAVVAEVHSYNGNYCPQAQSIDNFYGVNGYPYVVIDGVVATGNYGSLEKNVTNFSKILDERLAIAPKAGISASYAVSGNTLMARATVKAAESGEFRVGMWVLEDNIEAKQSNYGQEEAYAGQFDIHNDVLRYADSKFSTNNYTGYDLGTIQVGETKDYLFTLELDSSWIIDNCHLVFFVTSPESNNTIPFVNAVRTDSVNGSFAFEYK